MTKAEIRTYIKELVKAHKTSLAEFSLSISNEIIKSEIYKNSPVILAYAALPDEVDISPVIEDALERGKKVFLPKIKPGSSFMEFFPYENSIEIAPGSFGIMEPQTNLSSFELTDVFKTLVLVPGRAFCIDGSRLGRGKGFYDIYFQNKPNNVILAGVSFPFQVLEEIPVDDHDIKMDYLF